MTTPQSGWYPDPSGDQTRLRFWDGSEWTDDYMDAYAQPSPTGPSSADAPQAIPYGASAQNPCPQPTPPNSPYSQPYSQTPPAYIARPVYDNSQTYNVYTGEGFYPQTQEDRTLRLIAFILCLLSLISSGWMIFPLAWMIPMTVHVWGIYKAKSPNTVAFGVCTLLFVNIIAGILLLISHKDS